MNVIVGTWPELLTQAKNSHILPLHKENWQATLTAAAEKMPDAFWAKSRNIAPSETDAIIGSHLTQLLEGLGPARQLGELASVILSERLGSRINNFITLHKQMGGILDPELASINDIIAAGSERRLRSLRVYHLADWPKLNPWQQTLVDHLNSLAEPEDASLRQLLDKLVSHPSASEGTALRFAQEQIFTLPSNRMLLNPQSAQWLSLRDSLQEIEVCASMIQHALNKSGGELKPSNIAILIPDDEQYAAMTHSLFASAGLSLSDPGYKDSIRDLAAETLLNLLLSLNKPSPLLAVASLVTSPLMPWSAATGNIFAQRIMDGNFNANYYREVEGKEKELLEFILKGVSSPKQLAWFLTTVLSKNLTGNDTLKQHVKRAAELCTILAESLPASGDIPWKELIAVVSPSLMQGDSSHTLYQESIALFREGYEPWRKVKQLYVLGCSEGHYPSSPQLSHVFTEADMVALQTAGVTIETMSERSLKLRELFKRQISSATEHVTFFVPRRDSAGKPLAPSASLTFAARLFFTTNKELKQVDMDEETLCLELETADGRTQAYGVPVAAPVVSSEKSAPVPETLQLCTNLLQDNNGTFRMESPSRLETVMLSPLAWLFDRFGIKAREWEPESLDIMAKGTLAHDVFEHLFKPGGKIPTAAEIEAESGVKRLLADAIKKKMIFIENDEWSVERAHLERDIIKAALKWGEVLRKIGADIVAAEVPLQGTFAEIPVHGNADLLLELPDNRLLVVDYKKSGSKGRRTRMNEGYDSQAELYRTMIKSGGLEDKKYYTPPEGLKEKLALYRNAGEIGTLYYLMNDQTALSDTKGLLARNIAGVEEIKTDTSKTAMDLIRRRIRELSDGVIDLRLIEPEKDLKGKRGLGTYGLDSSPLVRMFLKEPLSKETVE